MNRALNLTGLLLLFLISFPLFAQNGIVRTYYDDGNIESELSYINDILDGISVFYYPNGNIREEIMLSYGKVNGVHKKFYPSGLIKEERSKKDGVMDGITKIYFENGALKQVLNYENGYLIKKIDVPFDPAYSAPIESFLAGNKQYKLSKESNIVSDSDISPIPVNGIKDIQDNLVYPQEAVNRRTEGIVTLSVKIDTTGKAGEFEVVKSLDKECDQAAITAIEKTKFLPGKNANRPVNSKIILNVTFKLEDKVIAKIDDVQKIRREIEEIITPENRIIEPAKEVSKDLSRPESKKNELSVRNEPKKEEIKNITTPVKEITESVSEAEPRPIGGVERILARTRVPGKAIELKIEGEVSIKVEVDKYGVVRDTRILKGLGYGIDEAIEVAIFDSPFKPGKMNGEPVKSSAVFNIPFTYKK